MPAPGAYDILDQVVHSYVIPPGGPVKIVPGHPSQKLPQDKLAKLYRVAGSEFAQHGFSGASLNRVIAGIGMSKSSFYHYFENKTDLFRQTLETAMKPMIDAHNAIDLGSLTSDTFWPVLGRMTEDMTSLVNGSPEMVTIGRMFYRCQETPDERDLTAGVVEEFTGFVSALIMRGQELGQIRIDLPGSLLIDLIMSLGMAADRWMLTRWHELSDAERIDLNTRTLDLFRRILAPASV